MGDTVDYNDIYAWTKATGRTEWEYRVEKRFRDNSDEAIVEQLNFACRRDLKDGHAISPKEVEKLRTLLRIRSKIDDEEILRHTDYFCIVVGQHARTQIDLKNFERRNTFSKEIIEPIRKLRATLESERYKKEVLEPHSPLQFDDLLELRASLGNFLEKAEHHHERIARLVTNKKLGADLKEFHVETAEKLMEFLSPREEPRRGSIGNGGWFLEYVRILAKPIFQEIGGHDGFPGATKTFVTDWTL